MSAPAELGVQEAYGTGGPDGSDGTHEVLGMGEHGSRQAFGEVGHRRRGPETRSTREVRRSWLLKKD